ncbi:bile acid:sodium symporter family protein [Candidatus Pelagibacter bacterium]|nr:bile acid:sodium symporter family protein [Candidatus Pelagibacter bacterium]MDC0530300.1 bile acid:sodium symporter family protein [Pelagibacteraceae bacterium]MDC0952357.1 bile acid:sodium symporter family protein [Pelagibacteraceae bacterium]
MEIAKTIAPLCLAIIMFGLGLGLTTSDFTRLLKKPRDFFVGFLSQVILLPVIAFGLILIIPMPIEIAMGVMIIAAAPGGVTSNVLTKFANGDVALSVSLTAVVSLLAIFIVPLIVFNSASFIGVEITKDISMASIAVKMFFVVTVPVLFGMIVRSLMTDFIISKTLIIQRLSIILFLIVFISIWVEEWDRIVSFIARAGLVTGILNFVMIFVGYYVAKMFASGVAQRKCISLECGLQNGTLAVVVATQLFDEMVFMVPTAAYALIMFVTSIFFVLIVRKIN